MSAVEVRNAKEVAKAFKDVAGKEGSKRLREAYKKVGQRIATRAQEKARAGTPLQAKVAGAIRAKATNFWAGLQIARTGPNKAAGVAFWGIDRRIGWFADPKYGDSTALDQRLPAWVGSSWKPAWQSGQFNEGPHAIREAVGDSIPQIKTDLQEAVLAAFHDIGFQTTK